jgi:hypothetical protein
MAAYDPKRPRPGGDAEEPPPVEALLDPEPATEDDVELVVVETVTEEVLVDEESGEIVGEVVITDDVLLDEATGEVLAEEITIEEIEVDPETGDVTVETTVVQAVAEEIDQGDEAAERDRTADALEVDLRDASPNGSAARFGSEVPVAPAPEEGTANRAVLIAGLGAAGLVALVLAILLRRRRRAD